MYLNVSVFKIRKQECIFSPVFQWRELKILNVFQYLFTSKKGNKNLSARGKYFTVLGYNRLYAN